MISTKFDPAALELFNSTSNAVYSMSREIEQGSDADSARQISSLSRASELIRAPIKIKKWAAAFLLSSTCFVGPTFAQESNFGATPSSIMDKVRMLVSVCRSDQGCGDILIFENREINNRTVNAVTLNPNICDEGSAFAETDFCRSEIRTIECLVDSNYCSTLPKICQLVPCYPGCGGSADCPAPDLVVPLQPSRSLLDHCWYEDLVSNPPVQWCSVW